MDLNDDGRMDVLSGSYSRMEQPMAGTFQVLWGQADGEFASAETLNATDDQPLIIPPGDSPTENICTRAFAADLNDDGNLDIVAGNFIGSFYLFFGKGKGKFNPEPKKLKSGKKDLMVSTHSDPFLVDWDNDGDLDLLSGSGSGGVFISFNEGNAKEPRFGKMETILPVKRTMFQFPKRPKFGDKHIRGPQESTRVWADDINGDGKLDILVGDAVHLMYPAEELDKKQARKKFKEWNDKYEELRNEIQAVSQLDSDQIETDESPSDSEIQEAELASVEDAQKTESESAEAEAERKEELRAEVQEKLAQHYEKRSEILREEMTGYVWVLYQK